MYDIFNLQYQHRSIGHEREGSSSSVMSPLYLSQTIQHVRGLSLLLYCHVVIYSYTIAVVAFCLSLQAVSSLVWKNDECGVSLRDFITTNYLWVSFTLYGCSHNKCSRDTFNLSIELYLRTETKPHLFTITHFQGCDLLLLRNRSCRWL